MKKLLGLTLALAMIIPPGQASAELLKNFKLSGGIDVQTDATRNVSDFVTRRDERAADVGNIRPVFNDRVNSAQTRIMLSMDWDWLDDVHSRLSLAKNDRTYGIQAGTARAGTVSQTLGTGVAGGGTAEANVYIDEAYFKIDKIFGSVDGTFGRQFYGQPGDLVVYYGPKQNLYGLPITAIDAVRADAKVGDMLSITGIAGKTTDGGLKAAAGVAAADAGGDGRGLNNGGMGLEGGNGAADIYNQLTHSVAALGSESGGNDNLYVYGVKGKVAMSGFTASLEVAKNGGENRTPAGVDALTRDGDGDGDNTGGAATSDNVYAADALYQGFAWKLDASYKADIEDVASFTPWLHFGWGSGRGGLRDNQNEGFKSIASDYRPGTIYGRFSNTGSLGLGTGIPCNSLVPGCTNLTGAAGNTGVWNQVPLGQAGLDNRVIWGLGLKTTPAAANQLTVAVSYWSFSFQRVTDDGYGTCAVGGVACVGNNIPSFNVPVAIHNGNVGKDWGTGQGNKHIGSELDLDLTWKHSDNVTLGAGVASFKPGKYIQSIIRDASDAAVAGSGTRVAFNSAVLAYGDVKVRF